MPSATEPLVIILGLKLTRKSFMQLHNTDGEESRRGWGSAMGVGGVGSVRYGQCLQVDGLSEYRGSVCQQGVEQVLAVILPGEPCCCRERVKLIPSSSICISISVKRVLFDPEALNVAAFIRRRQMRVLWKDERPTNSYRVILFYEKITFNEAGPQTLSSPHSFS